MWWLEPGAEEDVAAYIEGGQIQHVTAEEAEGAIDMVSSEGYWLLVELPDDRTLIVYQSLCDVGGKIPSWLINEFGPSGLNKLTRVIEERGKVIEGTFDGRTPPPAPDGSRVKQLP